MRESIVLRQQLQDSLQDEIAQRIQLHQSKIAALKMCRRTLAVVAPASAPPLVMLAHGDSWFDYPLDGNRTSLRSTDVIAQLETMGNINPIILNVSHHGDATTTEMALPKQQRLIATLQNPANWLNDKGPDAILFSGGGDDIAGDQFCIFLDYGAGSGSGLDVARFQKVLGMVQASYLDLFAFRDRYAPNVPIFGHCYDFPIPNGAHPDCIGPWLQPSLAFCGYTVPQGTAILQTALTSFKTMLLALANDPANQFFLVDTQARLRLQTGRTNCILIRKVSRKSRPGS